jgi:hypothetical protein
MRTNIIVIQIPVSYSYWCPAFCLQTWGLSSPCQVSNVLLKPALSVPRVKFPQSSSALNKVVINLLRSPSDCLRRVLRLSPTFEGLSIGHAAT